ncbi:twin-arginine translocation signal domain-containing protein [Streptomyces sp. NPDC041068]|uniref:twin-arginine translocation signal domain-containing protein n=1 Tax=Streptomyces sp. NPDC041068 TaxID=3155130 RepID=UPI003408DB3C
MRDGISRRNVVKRAGVITAAVAVGSFAPGVATASPARKSPAQNRKAAPPEAPTSANGWPLEEEANHISTVWTRPVPGTGLDVDVRIGDAELILLHVIRRFHYEVEQLPRVDLTGWRPIGDLNKDLPESNLASGTAVRIRPGAAAKGGLFPLQELVVRDILADCRGVVRWGGDDSPVDESLFYLDRGPDDELVRQVADKLRIGEATPGEGAGAEVDVMATSRREQADQLARQHRNR